MKKMKNQAMPLMNPSTSVFIVRDREIRKVLPLANNYGKQKTGCGNHDKPVRYGVDVLAPPKLVGFPSSSPAFSKRLD